MATLKKIICLIVLLAIFTLALGQTPQGGPHASQGGPHQNQGRAKRQVQQIDLQATGAPVNWTTCDPAVTPKYTCNDCNSRLICLPIGGKVISCPPVYAPYCVGGLCSSVPSVDCQ